MNNLRVKLWVAGLVLFCAVSYLAMTGLASGWVYYMTVDELLAADPAQDRRVRLVGVVGQEQFDLRSGELFAGFRLQGEAGHLSVAYRGVVPTTLAPGVEVVVEGRLDADGRFDADVLMTKCASKYQAQEHAQRLEMDHDQLRR